MGYEFILILANLQDSDLYWLLKIKYIMRYQQENIPVDKNRSIKLLLVSV